MNGLSIFLLVLAAGLAREATAGCTVHQDCEATFGELRVQALSETLIRLEYKGPVGFEDNTTFMVVNRDFPGLSLQTVSQSSSHVVLKTSAYVIKANLSTTPGPGPTVMCNALENHDIDGGDRIDSCQDMSKPCLTGVSQSQCCQNCSSNAQCNVWVYDPQGSNCWLLKDASGTHPATDRNCGGSIPGPHPTGISAAVYTADGSTLLWSADDLDMVGQNLKWPAPLASQAYAIKDYPRFYVPPWGPTPIPADVSVDPALQQTNGYDFRNNQTGDAYIFLLGNTLEDWFASRQEFVSLSGPVPLIPDYAFGTWFTYWHQYTESEAKGEIERWGTDNLPIDIW